MALPLLENKRALITGGGSGLSLALAKVLRARNVSILICDLSLHKEATTWLEETQNDSGPLVSFLRVDVTDWKQLEAAFQNFDDRFGGVPEIVVAGAGVYEASCPGFWDNKDQGSHYKLFDINLVHPIKLTRIAIRRMQRAHSRGVILHISSIVAQKPNVVLPLYAASKAGLSQFIRCMAPLEDMCAIRVVAVAPGIVDTPLFRDHPEAMKHIDMNKDFALPPSEVVKAMVALLTEEKYVGGTILEIGDIGQWRQVQILGDIGPQGRSTLPRSKAKSAVDLVKKALKADAGGRVPTSSL
ncbi:hypothetical protein PV08_04161 [Exophiala spinifera]|uniref:Uncharacterized protein n=1 Tax=Exophiala spinifera TaxID=91928 RepID=A0A0D2BEG3_9EURO|nr:uncharacterized protein PV08_04161 [Exophiala spinifera]KIW16970.1 hypothetical protein PV08_04161 [Exophiala spinifera]